MEDFQQNIKQWVAVDTRLKALNEEAKQLREQRNHFASEINIHVETHNLENAIVNISDGKLRFVSTKQTAPLTLKYVHGCLQNCISDPEQVMHIMEVIKKSRTVNQTSEIKRTYNE